MSDDKRMAEARARVAAQQARADDVAWLDSIGWNDASVRPVENAGQLADYERREQMLNRAIGHLTFPERAESPEGRVAAALGAAAANWRDKTSGDDAD